ncbi:methylmalonyl-CoA mutase [Actinopolyspora erythraea]|uniref:Methylmalonyl-CoA mutase n=1 Tax=Actinopolyspora erythraea TaxID=414996 RepID=A0A099D7Q6_9ACTN|nr:methylmalonyl-CoA mutase subunit beta [Actinopolyspora erythraea]ASU78298.1 methylmalonyl-CoA mutase [Actinopolyspora erythraea]KGI82009.1 methylmalonyl-CoA mutase [Actinopolyspora erythraea]
MTASERSASSEHGDRADLMAGFESPTHRQWQEQVEQVLRKSGLLDRNAPEPDAPEELLTTGLYDGFHVHPLYTSRAEHAARGTPGAAPFTRNTLVSGAVEGGWDVRQYHEDPDVATTNREVLADLAGGASSVWLRVGPGGIAVDDLGEALQGTHLDMAGVVLRAGEHYEAAADELLRLAEWWRVPRGSLRGNLGADPIGLRARTGREHEVAPAVELARRWAGDCPGMHVISVDGLPYHDAGGSDAEELGCAVAAGVEYLRSLAEAGMDLDTAAGLLEFRFAATVDQFSTTAKLRAARRMWERVLRACGVAERARGQHQHAVTSSAMLTRRDPWVNMLRSTIAAFGAGAGGARAVTVQPFDAAIGLPNAFSRRMARNVQALLLHETHLGQVIDPAGGSYYVESLTDELAEAGWRWFQRVESEGGATAALASGMVAERLATTWRSRAEALAHRTDPITGVSEFPDPAEEPLVRRARPAEPETGGLPRHRYAEDYERLRDAADLAAERPEGRPRVFLATLGPLASYTARASFTRNLLAAGGVEAVEAGETDDAAAVVAAFERAETPLVCLCSTDRLYDERAEATALALREAGARLVLLAGKPRGSSAESVDGFVHAGGDALRVLTDIHQRWGVAAPAVSGATS